MINITLIPAFDDNYLWLFHPLGSNHAYVVDPGDPAPVEAALAEQNLELKGILITHHHMDHIGGVEALTCNRQIPVYGPDSAKIPTVTHPLHNDETLSLEQGEITFHIIAVPGHTLEHIAYFDNQEQILFCGDTLFAGGCGRMFEGTPEQMQRSLAQLGALPAATRVYCAHEYTSANLNFANAVEPDNSELQQRIAETLKLRAAGIPTVPSTIALELATNPFLRVNQPSVIEAAAAYNKNRSKEDVLIEPHEVFAAIRSWKDNF